jgi:hypothetical protein
LEEIQFQKKINGNHASVDAMREIIGNKALGLSGLLELNTFVAARYTAQLFFDYGEGFSEHNSVKITDCFRELRELKLEYRLQKGVKRVRLDPCSFVCCAVIKELSFDGRVYDEAEIEINGIRQENGVLVFDTDDPNITVSVANEGVLRADIEVFELPSVLSGQLAAQSNVNKNGNNGMLSRVKGFLKKC